MRPPPPEPADRDHARYLRRLAALLGTAIATALTLVVLTDPYALHGMPVIEGFNAIKPYPQRHQNEIKLTRAEHRRAEVIIAGNSRAEIGFDPLGAARPGPDGKPERSASLALPGHGIGTTRAQLEYLERQSHLPRRIVLGLEFLDFIHAGKPRRAGAATAAAPDEHPAERLFWRFDSLFSLASLRDAMRTPLLQRAADPETLTTEGFNPLLDYRPLARREGYARLFRQRAQENAQNYVRLAPGVADEAAWADFEALLDLAGRNGTEVAIVIYPYHAQILSMFESAGLWPAFEAWKKRAVRSIEHLRSRHPKTLIALYDFSGYGMYACEHIPPPGDTQSETRWYWEAGHFKKALGDKILQRLNTEAPAFIPSDNNGFGMRIDSGSAAIDINRQRIATERELCLHDYPELFFQSERLIANARQQANSH